MVQFNIIHEILIFKEFTLCQLKNSVHVAADVRKYENRQTQTIIVGTTYDHLLFFSTQQYKLFMVQFRTTDYNIT